MSPIKVVVGVLGALVVGAAADATAQEVILVLRHAEQSPPPDLVLTEAGHRRAAALAHRLRDAGITVIFVTATARTQQMAAPLAQALGIQPKVLPLQDIDGLVKRVTEEHARDRVLIVNHALNLPAILKALGHPEPVSVALDEYDPLFVVVPRREGPPVVVKLRL